MNFSDYRLDFESSIRIKALGWVYRAQDPKNFYVSKIEFQKPGINPVYVLVHYAVIDGVEQPRVETPLQVSVPMGELYKIRFEAAGNRFTTWIQGATGRAMDRFAAFARRRRPVWRRGGAIYLARRLCGYAAVESEIV